MRRPAGHPHDRVPRRRAGRLPGPQGRPSRGSRGKKVYGITERGQALFEELLAAESQSSDDERVFNLRLAFARYLPPTPASGCSSGGGSYLLERLARTSGPSAPGGRARRLHPAA